MQEVRKGRVSSLGTAILVTTENAKDAEGSVPVRCHLGPVSASLEQYFRPILQGLTSGSLDRTWMDQPLTGSSNPCRIV
ncbi:4354_t:CDS:2, partial [Rhizophagus irregularis]